MIRNATLPIGWYPETPTEMTESIDRWARGDAPAGAGGTEGVAACVAPHAGWGFSGPLAAQTIARLDRTAGVVVIAGGHLRPGDAVLVSTAEGQQTPLGVAETAGDAAELLRKRFHAEEFSGLDNSTDVLVPMIQHFLPDASILVCRIPPAAVAEEVGKVLASYTEKRGVTMAVVGSTDLTHYGPSFGFTPQGSGDRAREWVVESNDAGFLEALVGMNAGEAMTHALTNQSACSPGGAAAALVYARCLGATKGYLVGHYTSYDIRPGTTFVGYAGVVFA